MCLLYGVCQQFAEPLVSGSAAAEAAAAAEREARLRAERLRNCASRLSLAIEVSTHFYTLFNLFFFHHFERNIRKKCSSSSMLRFCFFRKKRHRRTC